MEQSLFEKLVITQSRDSSPFIETDGSLLCSQEPATGTNSEALLNISQQGGSLQWINISPSPNPKLEDHPLSTVCDCFFNIIAATLQIWMPSPPFAT